MDTKERIMNEAGKMFFQYGIRSITMDRIAKDLGLSKRTLYDFFEDKDDLVRQVIIKSVDNHRSTCEKILHEKNSIVESIFNVLKSTDKLFGNINPLYFEDLKKYHSRVWSEMIECKRSINDIQMTEDLTVRAVREGIVQPNVNVELIKLLVEKLFEIIHLPEFKIFNSDDVFRMVFLSFLRGIATDKGITLIDESYENYIKNKNTRK